MRRLARRDLLFNQKVDKCFPKKCRQGNADHHAFTKTLRCRIHVEAWQLGMIYYHWLISALVIRKYAKRDALNHQMFIANTFILAKINRSSHTAAMS